MKTSALLMMLVVCSSVHAADTFRIDLGRGHFVIEADDTVDTLRVDTVDQPRACKQVLAATPIDSNRIDVRPTIADCRSDPYAIVHINPAWQNALDIRLAAGQVDFAASFVHQIGSVDASVNAGDIFGIPGVARQWLVGARAQVDRQRPGLAVQVRVGGGQISFASDQPVSPVAQH
jgi:hypothetical protein